MILICTYSNDSALKVKGQICTPQLSTCLNSTLTAHCLHIYQRVPKDF